MFWECEETLRSEDGARFPATFASVSEIVRAKRQLAAPNNHIQPRRTHGWQALVEGYTNRLMTRETDKLPALSGLAKHPASHTGDFYYTGLWRNHIWDNLLWSLHLGTHWVHLHPEDPRTLPA
jgi:hypothetical protein